MSNRGDDVRETDNGNESGPHRETTGYERYCKARDKDIAKALRMQRELAERAEDKPVPVLWLFTCAVVFDGMLLIAIISTWRYLSGH